MQFKRFYFFACGLISIMMTASIPDELAAKIIDDRSSGSLLASNGHQWRLLTDQVMGGLSEGKVTLNRVDGRACLQLSGDVSTKRNGGFIQMALDMADDHFDASQYDGIELQVHGNDEMYNLHLRTTGLWLPWQSYRSEFIAAPRWQTLRIPFSVFESYRTSKRFDPRHLTRLGLVAIGRTFKADLCVATVRLYRADE
jgi:hypothetical protein